MANEICGCVLERTAAELKTVKTQLAAVTDPNGDFISRTALLSEIESAAYWGRCTGLMDVLEIIRESPAVNAIPERVTDNQA